MDLFPVVRKPINANLQLKVNRGFHLVRQKCSLKDNLANGKEKFKTKLRGKNVLKESLLISN